MGIRKWTKKEVEFLKKNYGKMSNKEIAKRLNRSYGSIQPKAKELGLKFEYWTKRQINLLRELYPNESNKKISKIIKKNLSAINHMAKRLGLKKDKKALSKIYREGKGWTEYKVKYLIENYPRGNTKEIAKRLKKKVGAIIAMAGYLGIKKIKEPKWKWTEEEIEYFRKNYTKRTNSEWAKFFNKPRSNIQVMAKKLGLKKPSNKKMTEDKIEILKKYYANTSNKKLSEMMKVSISIIQKWAVRLKLKKSEEYLKKIRNWKGENNPFYGTHRFGKLNPRYGVHLDEKTKEKISKSNLGRKLTEEQKIKLRIKYSGVDFRKYKKTIIELYQKGFSANTIKLILNLNVHPETIINYLKRWKIKIRPPLYGPNKIFKADDGHKVKSGEELFIDNLLFHNGIEHIYEKHIGNSKHMCDFYIPELDLYIEYWGLEGNLENYNKRMKIKLDLYKKLGLNLLSIYPRDNIKEKLAFLIPLCSKTQKTIPEYLQKEIRDNISSRWKTIQKFDLLKK